MFGGSHLPRRAYEVRPKDCTSQENFPRFVFFVSFVDQGNTAFVRNQCSYLFGSLSGCTIRNAELLGNVALG